MILLRLRASLLPCTRAAALVVSLSTGSALAQLQFAPAKELEFVAPIMGEFIAPSLSGDGLTLYLSRAGSAGGEGGFDIWTATRPTRFGAFGALVNLGAIVNSKSNDRVPSISPNGLSLYFASNRPGGLGGQDLYVAARTSINGAFGDPVNLGDGVNSIFDEQNPAITSDGLMLAFGSLRPAGHTDQNLFIATRPTTADSFRGAEYLGDSINRFIGHGSPSFSPDSLNLFYVGYDGTFSNIYVSTRALTSAPWGAPVKLGPNVNAGHEDFSEFASDGKSIVFISDRSGVDRMYEAAVVPEPSSWALAAISLCGAACVRLARAERIRPRSTII